MFGHPSFCVAFHLKICCAWRHFSHARFGTAAIPNLTVDKHSYITPPEWPVTRSVLIVFVQSGCWSAFVTAPPTRPKSQTDALAPLVSPPFYLVFSRPTDTSRHVAVCAPDLHSEASHLLFGPAPHVRCGTPLLLHCRFCINVLRCGIITFSAHTNVCVQPLTQFHLP